MIKVLLKQDSRDIHVKDYFGSVTAIPETIEFDKNITNPIESPFDVDCTAISATDVCTNQTGTKYNIDDLWALTPHDTTGADPRDSMGTLVKYGLQPVNGGPRDTRWLSYFRSDGQSGDYAATTQSSMIMTQSPTTVASNWYSEWNTAGPDEVLPMGKIRVSGHDYEITGWRMYGLALQFHVKHWRGYFVWMPKDIFNIEMDKYGTGAYIPTTTEITIEKKTILQKLIDACINLVLLLQRKLTEDNQEPMPIPVPTIPPIAPTVPNKIVIWAGAIAKREGANPTLNNPANFGYTNFMATQFGAKPGPAKPDGGRFCQFDTYEQGFNALCGFLTLGAKDQLKDYHNARTIKQFTLVYTNHPKPTYDYSDSLIKELGVTPDTNISTFL